MIRQQAYVFRLEPNGEQIHDLRCYLGARRFVYNKGLVLQSDRYRNDLKHLNYALMCKQLIQWKHDPTLSWLKDAPSQVLQQGLKDLKSAFTNFFELRAEYPKLKKKGTRDSIRYPQGFELDEANKRMFLPKLGWIPYRKSRQVFGTIKNVTVRCKAGEWYMSVQTEREVDPPVHPSTTSIGIDMGITRFATLSDGTFFAPVNAFKKHEEALAKAQQRLAHIKKYSSEPFSQNRRKATLHVQAIHHRIACVRNDFLHKASTMISKNHALICLEDLQIQNMSASASGTLENPGKNVKAKSGLNKAILDQGWGEFRRQLEYKQAWLGGRVVAVPAYDTSRTCPECDHVAKENRLTQAQFKCIACSYANHADVVGALNALQRGENLIFQEGQDTTGEHHPVGCTRTAQLACEVNGAARPSAAGTRRSDCSEASSVPAAQ